MTYTFWSHGRLLGTSDLDYVRCIPRLRSGDLISTEFGESILPVAAGVPPTSIALGHALKTAGADVPLDDRGLRMRRMPEYVAFEAAVAAREALHLELRGPDGSVIPTESIDVRDTEYLLSLAVDDDWSDELEPTWLEDLDLEDDLIEVEASDEVVPFEERERSFYEELEAMREPEREWPRYQLMVTLIDDAAIP